ncbi:hypothetical protein ACJJTC_002056 [Scirpophaga incertulas]
MASTSSGFSITTRNQSEIWLIGQLLYELSQSTLPSIGEVLRYFFYYKNEEKKSIRESATLTACGVINLWEKAGIPIQLKKHVISKIEKLFKEWQNLKKNKENKKKRSEALKTKEQNWQQKLEDLFDIAHRDALNIMTLEEDKQFLLAVRQNRRQFLIGSVDRKSLNKCKKIKEKKERLDKLRERENKDISSITEKCSLSSLSFISSSSATTSGEVTPSDPEFISKLTKMQPPQKRARKDIINSQLASSLDVSKLSDRKSNYGQSLKSEFKPSSSLTIHWDGKLIEDITGHKTVDRLPILVSGHGVDQLLAVPKLERGTSEACASAVYDAINSWNLSDKVKCLCFDTTAVNTGLRSGVCVLLERKMDKNMLWFACRHHIMEIMLSGVVDQSLAPSSGPDIQLFKRFKNSWDSIDQSDFKTITDDAEANILAEVAADRISFAKKQLQVHQPRDDYKEMLNLTIIFLGGVPEKGVSFRRPAGLHRARWMARALYCLKIYLFKHQLKLTKKDEKAVREICIFTVMIYIKYWFQASTSQSAPRNDLQLLKDLKAFESVNKNLATIALKKILNHLWYLSEDLVSLAFFDDELSVQEKKKMVEALKIEGTHDCLKRINLDMATIHEKNIENFVSSNSLKFFQVLGISSDFFYKDVETWNEDPDYIAAKNIVHSLRVVNDIAERGVALMEEYNKLITTNEEQKQYLLLLVKEYRKKYPNTNKSTLAS